MTVRTVAVDDGHLEIDDRGSGEPIVFVQTALTADHLAPLASQPALDRNHRRLLYHRRGYAGSSPACAAPSIVSDAADARELLTALGIERAHVVGASFSAAIALQLAADAPERVQSLVLVEAPPVHTSHAPAFRDANEELLRIRREHGVDAALDVFLEGLVGPDWRPTIEVDLPGAVVQIERDAATFFDHDTPALLEWHFGPADAGRIRCPVLYVGGSDSGPWFAEVRELLQRHWLPHAEGEVIAGAGHSVALTHAPEVAEVVRAFLRRHPIDPQPDALEQA